MITIDYLFFDTESAHGSFNRGVMCSFGYVLCDEKFNIIEEDDILINPGIEDHKWQKYVLDEILAYDKSVYKCMSDFPHFYNRIKTLLTRPDTMIINQGIENDAKILAATIKRYNLDQIDYRFYDLALFYKKYKNLKRTLSLDEISSEVCFEHPRDRHPSLEDAQRVYRIMRTISIVLNKSIKELFEDYPYCDGEVVNGRLVFNRQKEIKPILNNNDSNVLAHAKKRFYVDYINNLEVKDNPKSEFNRIKYYIDYSYMIIHFREMLYITTKMAELGAIIQKKAVDSDLYVKQTIVNDGKIVNSNTTNYVLEAIAKGKKIEIVELEWFLEKLGVNDNVVQENFDKLKG